MVDKAWIREVGLRDGLQMVKTMLPTEQKLEFARAGVSPWPAGCPFHFVAAAAG